MSALLTQRSGCGWGGGSVLLTFQTSMHLCVCFLLLVCFVFVFLWCFSPCGSGVGRWGLCHNVADAIHQKSIDE